MMDGHIILLTISRRGYYYYHYGCPRGHEQVSVAILGFTWAASWPSLVQRKGLDWEDPLSEQDQKNIWMNELHWWFLSERPENCSRTKVQLRSIYRVWLRQSFGDVQAIRDILRNSCCWATWRELAFRQNVMTADPNLKP